MKRRFRALWFPADYRFGSINRGNWRIVRLTFITWSSPSFFPSFFFCPFVFPPSPIRPKFFLRMCSTFFPPPHRFCFHSSNTSPCRSSIHPPSPFVCRFHGNELCWGEGEGETIIKNLMDRVMVVKSNLERCNQNSEYGSQPAVIEGEIAATMTRIPGSLRTDR